MTLLAFSFLAGAATMLAPCIWPLLPIVLSVSANEGKRRPLGLTLGVMTSFFIFTLFVSYLESILHISPNTFRFIAVIIIALLGVSMLFPDLGARFEVLISRLLQPLQQRLQGQNQGTGFGAGYISGFSVGLVWAPCAGPILATIATLAATQSVDLRIVFMTAAYALGLGIPLFLVALGGSTFFAKMRHVNRYTGRIQQAFGVVMVAAAILIYTNYDKTLQLKILNAFPNYGKIVSGLEESKVVSDRLERLRGKSAENTRVDQTGKLSDLGPVPEFAGIPHWLNTAPLTMSGLRGNVVLVDFWTYSCINCLRTLPYTRAWYEAYSPQGFVLVGVHTPEFAFEKETDNVKRAIAQFGIKYPVAQDNDYKTWSAFRNNYWPAEFLIDGNGHIRLAHFGEGHYAEMESAIRTLLAETGRSPTRRAKVAEKVESEFEQTPETYLGLARLERFASKEKAVAGEQRYSLPAKLQRDQFAYEGSWTLSGENAVAKKGAALEIEFAADQVYLVIGPGKSGDRLALILDGKPLAESAGKDVKGGRLILGSHRLYHLVDLKGKPGEHRLRIVFDDDDDAVYAFTFG